MALISELNRLSTGIVIMPLLNSKAGEFIGVVSELLGIK